MLGCAEYLCGFPVHQDGSCNGLQHYAALGGDAAGARAVNLAPLARPQDVYSAVAALVTITLDFWTYIMEIRLEIRFLVF